MAQRRLTGKQKKNPRFVAALEEAFNKVTARDMQAAQALAAYDTPDWDRLYKLYRNIDRRQQAIRPLLPLTDKNGYTAQLRLARVAPLLANAAEQAAQTQYAAGVAALAAARSGDKAAARAAYRYFRSTRDYHHDYRDSRALAAEAEQLGIVYVAVEIANTSDGYLPAGFTEALLRVPAGEVNDRWTTYDFVRREGRSYDYNARMLIQDIAVSPERVSERTYTDQRTITDGEEYVLDANGNVAKDTLGNDITRPREVVIAAEVLELYQQKTAVVSGELVLYDNATRQVVHLDQLTAEAIFEHYASTFRGDRRALSKASRQRIGNQPQPFPTDASIILTAAEALKPQLTERLARSQLPLAR